MGQAPMTSGRDDADDGPALCRLARERTEALIEQAGRQDGCRYRLPLVRVDLRGQTAGQFRIERDGRAVIRYNLGLLRRYRERFLRQTVPHEVAHYLAFARYGRNIRPHGPEWQRIVRALGGAPERCHDYDTAGLGARRLRRFLYHCGCGEHELSSVRHNRVGRGASYLCRRCGEPLRAGPAEGGD